MMMIDDHFVDDDDYEDEIDDHIFDDDDDEGD